MRGGEQNGDDDRADLHAYFGFFFLLRRTPMTMQIIPSMISSAPQPMGRSRVSRKARAAMFSQVKLMLPKNVERSGGNCRCSSVNFLQVEPDLNCKEVSSERRSVRDPYAFSGSKNRFEHQANP